jgi:hypothetical protein
LRQILCRFNQSPNRQISTSSNCYRFLLLLNVCNWYELENCRPTIIAKEKKEITNKIRAGISYPRKKRIINARSVTMPMIVRNVLSWLMLKNNKTQRMFKCANKKVAV